MVAKKNNFETQLTELQKIVSNLESGNVSLEEALEQFQTGVKLSKELDKNLTTAEQTVAKLIDQDGTEQQIDPTDAASPEE